MADVLSQSEVESLLPSLAPGTAAPPAGEPDATSQVVPSSGVDDRRSERLSCEQIRVIQALHEGFSREFSAALSEMLRTSLEVKLIRVDQMTCGEFVFSLENPTCFNVVESKGLGGHILLDLTPSIVFPLVGRLLGGGRDAADAPSRALTEIELKLVSRITNLGLDALENSWSSVCTLDAEVVQVESNPQLVQVIPPNEIVLLVSFEILMGTARGIMSLCVPCHGLESLAGRLSADAWTGTRRVPDPVQRGNLATGVADAPVEVVVVLAETKLTAAELRNLAVGDILVTGHPQSAGLTTLVEDRPFFEGPPGVFQGRKAVRISKRLEPVRELLGRKLDEAVADSAHSDSE